MKSIKSKDSSKNEGVYSLLKNTKLFSSLSNEILEDFIKHAYSEFYLHGENIYREEEKAEFFYIIKKGYIKLFHEQDNKEIILDIISTNCVFGEDSLFNNNLYTNSAKTVENVELIIIPISHLASQIIKNDIVACRMFYSMSSYRKRLELRNSNSYIKSKNIHLLF